MNSITGQKNLWLVTILGLILLSPTLPIVLADSPVKWNNSLLVFVGNTLVINSDEHSIQQRELSRSSYKRSI